MTTSTRKQFSLGAILIALGIFVFLFSTGLLSVLSDTIGALLFFALATIFLRKVRQDRHEHWWALIPGFTLFGLGVAAMTSGAFSGGYFLAITGAGFAMVYLFSVKRWWALIPAGVLATLGLVATLDEAFAVDELGGAVFFLGLAATFGLLYVLPTSRGRQPWALYPAIAAAVLAMFTMSFASGPLGLLWPLLLIGVGAYLLIGRNSRASKTAHTASANDTSMKEESRELPAAEQRNAPSDSAANNRTDNNVAPGDLNADDQLRKLSS